MDVGWLRQSAEATRTARYSTVLELRRIGLEIEARVEGGVHRSSTIVTWSELEAAEANPLPRIIDQVNQDLGRKIARRGEPARPYVIDP